MQASQSRLHTAQQEVLRLQKVQHPQQQQQAAVVVVQPLPHQQQVVRPQQQAAPLPLKPLTCLAEEAVVVAAAQAVVQGVQALAAVLVVVRAPLRH